MNKPNDLCRIACEKSSRTNHLEKIAKIGTGKLPSLILILGWMRIGFIFFYNNFLCILDNCTQLGNNFRFCVFRPSGAAEII